MNEDTQKIDSAETDIVKDQNLENTQNETKSATEENNIEEKLKETEDKLLRSLAEIENQRRRFEREIKDAFEFGSFNFAKESLVILDNLQRAKLAIKMIHRGRLISNSCYEF